MRIATIMAAAITLAACSTAGTPNTASAEYEALKADCIAKGGELKRIPGSNAPQDAANYACEFRGTPPTKG